MLFLSSQRVVGLSLSARRAWIEIIIHQQKKKSTRVALRKESVDRNHAPKYHRIPPRVALRKESVDRNISELESYTIIVVALRKESVDRNCKINTRGCKKVSRSPQGERG